MTNAHQSEGPRSEDDWARLWDEELARRLRLLDEGRAVLIPSEDVMRAAWRLLQRQTNSEGD